MAFKQAEAEAKVEKLQHKLDVETLQLQRRLDVETLQLQRRLDAETLLRQLDVEQMKRKMDRLTAQNIDLLGTTGQLGIRTIIESLEIRFLPKAMRDRTNNREELWRKILDKRSNLVPLFLACNDPRNTLKTKEDVANAIAEIYRMWSDGIHKYFKYNGQPYLVLPKNIGSEQELCLANVLAEIKGLRIKFVTGDEDEDESEDIVQKKSDDNAKVE